MMFDLFRKRERKKKKKEKRERAQGHMAPLPNHKQTKEKCEKRKRQLRKTTEKNCLNKQ